MFQEIAYDRADRDIFADPGNAGPDAADASYDQFDLHSCRACSVKRFHDIGIAQGVHLGDDVRCLAVLGVPLLASDQVDKSVFEPQRSQTEFVPESRL